MEKHGGFLLRPRVANRRLGQHEIPVAGDAVALQELRESCQWAGLKSAGSMTIRVAGRYARRRIGAPKAALQRGHIAESLLENQYEGGERALAE